VPYVPPLTDVVLIDVTASYGPAVPSSRSTTAERLRTAQSEAGIAHTLAYNSSAVTVQRRLGNERTFDEVPGPGMSPVVVATEFDLPSLAGELARAVSLGAVAVRVEPQAWTDTSDVRALFAAAAATGLPILAPCRGAGDSTVIGRLSQEFEAETVLVQARYPQFPEVMESLRRYPRLHIETSSLGGYHAIDTVAGIAGYERMLFGTGTPVHATASPLATLAASALPERQKRAILGGNAIRLFGLSVDGSHELAVSGPERIFDVHGHFFPAPLEVVDTVGSFLDDLRGFPIETAVSSSIPAVMGDLEFGNSEAVRIARETPGQLAYLVAHPSDPDLAVEHLRRWGDDPAVAGVKVHIEWAATTTAGPRVAELFERLDAFRRPVLVHNVGAGWQDALIRIARSVPQTPIIVAHGGYHRPDPDTAAVVNSTENVHVEFASSKADIRDARDLARLVPAERILFGSDAPLIDPYFVLGMYESLGLVDPDAAYHGNAARLFGRG